MSWLQSTVNHSNEGSYCYQWYASNTEQNQVSAFYWPRKSVSHGMCDAYATSCLFKMNTLVYYDNNNSVIRRSATTECQVNRWIVPIIQIVPNWYFEITLPWMILFYEKQFKVPPTYFKGEIFKSLKIQFLPNLICIFLCFLRRPLETKKPVGSVKIESTSVAKSGIWGILYVSFHYNNYISFNFQCYNFHPESFSSGN